MAHYDNAELGVSFDVADRFTVREQLAYRSRLAEGAGQPGYVRHWLAAPSVVTGWQCDLIPDMAAFDLDAATDARAVDIIQWTANTVAAHMFGLETPGPNS